MKVNKFNLTPDSIMTKGELSAVRGGRKRPGKGPIELPTPTIPTPPKPIPAPCDNA